MYRLLIVDDEEIIVNSLFEMFNSFEGLELDVYKAYSGEEAINWLGRTRIDIVISDIRMPEMDGMKLLSEIHVRWPWCKVIFLTGYDSFDYIYQALKVSDVTYILKSEDPDEVINAVMEATKAIEQSNQVQQYLQTAKKQTNKANILMKRDYLMGILMKRETCSIHQNLFDTMGIPLSLSQPVIYAVGHPLKPMKYRDFVENIEHFLSLKKLLEQKIWMKCRNVVILDHNNNLHIFTQLLEQHSHSEQILSDSVHEELVVYLKGMLEMIQMTCMKDMSTPIGFVIGDKPSSWQELPETHKAINEVIDELTLDQDMAVYTLKDYFRSNFNRNKFLLLDNQDMAEMDKKQQISDFEWIEMLLNNGNREQYFEEMTKVTGKLKNVASMHNPYAIATYYNCATRLLNHINRKEIFEVLALRIGQGGLMKVDNYASWEEATKYLMDISNEIFRLQQETVLNKEEQLIERIQSFIKNNLAQELSLVQLSEYVYMSPSYLSRFYKRRTGENLSDYIDKQRVKVAKEMLRKGEIKIYEIAHLVGYDNPGSFTRFFKKVLHMTPVEYTDYVLRKDKEC